VKLSELIAKYGDDVVQFQNLDQCTKSLNMNKGHTTITFGAEQPITMDGTVMLGLVVWLDRDRVAQIVAESKKDPTP
jgi:hypothetical protein